jgi:hypothetical protein
MELLSMVGTFQLEGSGVAAEVPPALILEQPLESGEINLWD